MRFSLDDKALAFIQNVERLARLNPLVTAVEKTGKEHAWKVTDRIMFLGIIPYSVNYEISAVHVEDGSDISVSAPMGTRSFSKWRVTGGEETGCTVIEEASIEAPGYLLPFIKRTLKQSHEKMLERMEVELLKDVSKT